MDTKNLPTGLYEQVINTELANKLMTIDTRFKDIIPIDQAEAATILADYLRPAIQQGLSIIAERNNTNGLQQQIAAANKLISLLTQLTQAPDLADHTIDQHGEQLLALLSDKDNLRVLKESAHIPRPQTSLAQTSLFTGAKYEPSMFRELKQEILSCDRIDMLVSFIKWSGLRLIAEELQTFTQNGGRLRLIATSYMGATDVKAIDYINTLANTEIRISYDTKRTRLHAKAYIFYRNTGFTTAYIGSSNLSNAAISSGLEWNVKITATDLPATMDKVRATFNTYWHSPEFELYTPADHSRLQDAIDYERHDPKLNETRTSYDFTIRPYPYQQKILEALAAERTIRGNCRNLIVAATGTGKTVISAFDYQRFCEMHPGKANRLLFIAHREEILRQSIACFQGVLHDPNFGELFFGRQQPKSIDHLFMSIQTFCSQKWETKTSADFYDYIVIDEIHHGEAASYQAPLTYYTPQILLGLTATPERMDGKDITEYFGYHITAEIRLPEAIERKLLCPFQYFGVSDTVDLSTLKWSGGQYDRHELANVYTLDQKRAEQRAMHIIESLNRYATDLNKVHGVGFCVSVQHAEFMAAFFSAHNIPALSLSGNSPEEFRLQARQQLTTGKIRFIFVVDLYNEGVDIPEIDTILFLRPTESLTIFLQQLGRGLRLAPHKECLTVLDFIGQANKKYRFEEKFNALLSHTRGSIEKEIRQGFASVPHGCYIQLEKKSREYILDNIRASLNTRNGLIEKLHDFVNESRQPLSLRAFLDYYHLDIRQIYRQNYKLSFSRLCAIAKVTPDFHDPDEKLLTSALTRICAIDSRRWIQFLLQHLTVNAPVQAASQNPLENRLWQMLHFTIYQNDVTSSGFHSLSESLAILPRNPALFAEILEVLKYNYQHIDFIDEPVAIGFDSPLDLHCHYTRNQICAALDYYKPGTLRQGVMHLKDKKLDFFLITLNKSEKDYSPTTMYEDYSINETLFHWQSQSTTSADSPTGQRYIHQQELGSRILLFVREYDTDLTGTAPYIFLGLANYVSHEGSRPMSIIWHLEKPIPAKFLNTSNKLVVG